MMVATAFCRFCNVYGYLLLFSFRYDKIKKIALQYERNLFMNHVERSEELFFQGYNCSQSVFAAFADVMKLDESTALKLSSSFGGGIGRMREVCGACSGVFMVIGLLYGYDEANDEKRAEHYARIQRLANIFKQQYGSIICRELLASLSPSSSPTPTPRTPEFYRSRPCLKFIKFASALIDDEIKKQENLSHIESDGMNNDFS